MYRLAAKLFLVFAFCGLSQRVMAQEYVYRTYDITTANGLLSNRVASVYQDDDGFIWLLTQEGIGRFDGHDFKWITKKNSNLRGIPRGHAIIEDAEGFFWFTDGVHVDLINRRTYGVIPLREKFKSGLPFRNAILRFWQGPNEGVYIKERDTDAVYYYHPSTGFEALPQFQDASSITLNSEGLWVCYKDGDCLKYKDHHGPVIKSFSGLDRVAYSWITNYRAGEDWFTYYDPETQEVVILKVLQQGQQEVFRIASPYKSTLLRFMIIYDPVIGQLILNTPFADHTFSIVDLEQKQIIPVKAVTQGGDDPFLHTYFIDNRGIHWQQSPRGIRLLKVSKSIFSRYTRHIQTRGLWASQDQLLIQNNYLSFSEPDELQIIAEPRKLKSVWTTKRDELWVGADQGIFQLDTASFAIKQKVATMPGKKGLWAIARDQEDRWWAGGLFTGLFLKTKPDTLLRRYTELNGFEELQTSSIIHLLEDGSFLWGCTNTGLYLLDKEKGVVRRYYSEAEEDQYLPFYDVHFLHKDQAGVYWVATNADGLIRFELDEDLNIAGYRQYTTDDNLSSNILYAILEDRQERLWISTLTGLSCFDKRSDKIQIYLTEDGLAESEFNRISYYQDSRGKIYFGSIRGVVAFHPDDIPASKPYDADVRLSSLTLYDGKREQFIEYSLQDQEEIILQPQDRFLRLNVTMLDYFQAEQLSYTYQIDELIEEYQKINGNELELGGLPYGRHIIRIRGQSRDRRYAQEELILRVRVLRPFYYRWWFILLLSGAFIVGILQFYFWRIRQLSKRRHQLEVMVKVRTEQIEKDNAIISSQAAKLRELDELKSRFFTNISHELRTPLTLILAPLEGVLKQSKSNNRIFPRLQLMQQNGQRLLKRINELLDLSSLDANRLSLEEVDTPFYAFLQNNLAAFSSMAKLKSIELQLNYQLPESLVLLLDQDKLEKIISNFLSNAIKFTDPKGTVVLQTKQLGDQLQLSVADTGIGIAQPDLERIFERFYQVSQSNQQSGSGIGLALCHELASVLGGRVWAESEVGTGSVFYVQLPLVESQDTNLELVNSSAPVSEVHLPVDIAASGGAATNLVNRPTILVVEDNVDLRGYLELILASNYQVVAVEYGAMAVHYLEEHERPALIISDIMMPVMDGLTLLTEVKKSENWCSIPIIMLTASQRSEVKLEALRIGVDDYLIKPFKEEELLTRIKNLLRNYREGAVGVKLTKEITASDLRWLEELERILQQYLASPTFKLPEAATAMNISYRRLQQKLKALTGMTPKRYQRTIKLAKARELLKSGQFETVTEVMYQLGFDNLHYFSKLYKEEFGVKPIEEL
ncbi:MAG: ATP-binding protein [Bacteroidota bacterium]